MKNFKKLMALVIAAVMVMGTMTAMVGADTVGQLSVNSDLSVSGLGANDEVAYYQILKWNSEETATTTQGWVWGDSIVASKATEQGITPEDFYGSTDGANPITFALAGKAGNAVGDAMTTPAGSNDNGTWTVSDVPAGLYMVVVTSKTPGVMYNPIFVAANWKGTDEIADSANAWIVDSAASYQDKAVAKKSSIPLNKTSTGRDDNTANLTGTTNSSYTTDVGEIVDFTITSKIPKFGDNYVRPVFTLTDTLTGLALETLPVVKDSKDATLVAGTDYVLTGAVGDGSYTIAFTADYLKNKNTNQVGAAGEDITITYAAKVTDAAEKVVNQENNTVELKFSSNPKDTEGKAKLEDETNHYTFSIDAKLLGDKFNEGSSTEAIKIGVDKEGNPIVSMQSYAWNEGVQHAALEGAEFTLYNADGTTPYVDGNGKGRTVTSDATGRITITGLDVGTYYLKETKAPTGYIKLQEGVKVEISAVIDEEVTVDDSYELDGTPVTTTHKTNVLKSYTVTIGGATTSYTMVNSADKKTAVEVSRHVDSSDKELANTKGVELPSTGGMGTTLFYAIGAILVLGAGILLVSKRRMSAN